MKKTLTISFNSGNYCISDGTKEVVVHGADLILKGQDLFDNFYKDFRKDDFFEAIVSIDSSVVDSKDKYIAGEIKKILDEINEKLSQESKNVKIANDDNDEKELMEQEKVDIELIQKTNNDDETFN